jgi:hypothetical protein
MGSEISPPDQVEIDRLITAVCSYTDGRTADAVRVLRTVLRFPHTVKALSETEPNGGYLSRLLRKFE